MKKINWRKYLAPLVILYVVIWVGFCGWAAHQSRNNYWLVEREATPTVTPLFSLGDDDWCAILANPAFASKAGNERMGIANKKFEEIKSVADEIGHDLKALKAWYYRTATDFEHYPVRVFRTSALGQDMVQGHYRDLRESGFPKPSVARVFWRYLFTRESMWGALIVLPFLVIPLLVIVGSCAALLSKKLSLKWKILTGALIATIFVEGWLIKFSHSQPVSLGMFNFYDSGDYVSAEGTWTSDTKLATPLQVTKLDCWQNWNHCIEATAEVFGGSLSVRTSYWEIENWGQDELTFKENTNPVCVNERFRIDRKNKVVTYTRATKQPKPDNCSDISDEPIVSYLTDGWKLQHKKR